MNYVLDTNVVIYAHKGTLAEALPEGRYFVSIVTEIELLSFPDLSSEQERALLDLLCDVTVIGIDSEVKRRTVELRRTHRLRIPDAIIVATALAVDAELLTNDAALSEIPDLRVRTVTLRSE